jgi:hypothetical protein
MTERELLDFAVDELNFHLDVHLDRAGMIGRLGMFAI